MRRIRIEFAGREFSLLTDESDDIVENVVEELKKILGGLEGYVEEHSMEEILMMALANTVLEKVKLRSELNRLLEKLREWSDEGGAL